MSASRLAAQTAGLSECVASRREHSSAESGTGIFLFKLGERGLKGEAGIVAIDRDPHLTGFQRRQVGLSKVKVTFRVRRGQHLLLKMVAPGMAALLAHLRMVRCQLQKMHCGDPPARRGQVEEGPHPGRSRPALAGSQPRGSGLHQSNPEPVAVETLLPLTPGRNRQVPRKLPADLYGANTQRTGQRIDQRYGRALYRDDESGCGKFQLMGGNPVVAGQAPRGVVMQRLAQDLRVCVGPTRCGQLRSGHTASQQCAMQRGSQQEPYMFETPI